MFAQMGSELGTRILRSAVGMKYRTRSKLDVFRGHGDRVTDQAVAHSLGHRPAHNRLGMTVDHRGQVEPPSPRSDVRNIPYEPGPWGRSGEVPLHVVGDGRRRSRTGDRGDLIGAGLAGM